MPCVVARRSQEMNTFLVNGQLAPSLSIHRMPSRQAKTSTRGRPPSDDESGSPNRFLIVFRWTSETNGFGAVLDPVVFGRCCFGHEDSWINMRAAPLLLALKCKLLATEICFEMNSRQEFSLNGDIRSNVAHFKRAERVAEFTGTQPPSSNANTTY